MSKMADIRKYYGVPAKRGMRVRFTNQTTEGVITGTTRNGFYLSVQFPKGTKVRVHPYDLDYILSDEQIVLSEPIKSRHDAKWDAFNRALAKDIAYNYNRP